MEEEHLESSGTQTNLPVRYAEKKRKFLSNPFADYVAQVCVEKYEELCPEQLKSSFKQTVLAAVVVQIPKANISEENGFAKDEFLVLSLGVGTKMVGQDAINTENRELPLSGNRFLRDLHAEVLAKRGFQKFLINHRTNLISSRNDSSKESKIFHFDSTTNLLKLQAGVKIHLYSSSQPCGNACIKKWAKIKNSKSSVADPAAVPHPPFFVTARSEGQIAPLVKRNNSLLSAKFSFTLSEDSSLLTDEKGRVFPLGTAPVDTGLGNIMTCSDKIAKWTVLGLQGNLLSAFFGPCYLSSIIVGRKFSEIHGQRAFCCRIGSFHYCNGLLLKEEGKKNKKIKTTNDQPTIMSIEKDLFKSEEIPVQAKTLGNETLDPALPPLEESSNRVPVVEFRTHHPVLYGTSVKFDDSSVLVKPTSTHQRKEEQGEERQGERQRDKDGDEEQKISSEDKQTNVIRYGADFSETRCFVSWMKSDCDNGDSVGLADYEMEILDGNTGYLIQEKEDEEKSERRELRTVSQLSSYSFHQNILQILELIEKSDEQNDSSFSLFRDTRRNRSFQSYKDLKQKLNHDYYCAEQYLYHDKDYFYEWIQK
jgi:hypothetical protein